MVHQMPAAVSFVLLQLPLPTIDLYPLAARLIGVLVVMGVALVAARWSRVGVRHALARAGTDANVTLLLQRLVHFSVLAVGVLVALPVVGIDLAASVTVFGVAGLTISLALRDVLANLVAGVYILLERPFSIGDRIQLPGGHRGEVETIALRTTMLRTETNTRVIVPNAKIYSSIIVNRSAFPARRGELLITLEPGDEDLEALVERLQTALRNVPNIVEDPAPIIGLDETSGGKATFRLQFWAPSPRKAAAQVVWELRSTFPDADIGDPDSATIVLAKGTR
jgi:small-conductance mechanosensitive channel